MNACDVVWFSGELTVSEADAPLQCQKCISEVSFLMVIIEFSK